MTNAIPMPMSTEFQITDRVYRVHRLTLDLQSLSPFCGDDVPVRSEFVLMALAAEEGGVAAKTLRKHGVTADLVAGVILGLRHWSVDTFEDLALRNKSIMPGTPSIKFDFQWLGSRYARANGHNYVGTESVLYDLLEQDGDRGAWIVLDALQRDVRVVQHDINNLIKGV